MAKTTKNDVKQTSRTYDLNSTLTVMKRREFWIGLVTTLLFVVVAIKVLPWSNLTKFMAKKPATVLSPIPSTAPTRVVAMENKESSSAAAVTTVTFTPTPSTSSAVLSKSNSKLKAVHTLADTNGYYVVEEGDNYYKISKKVCGDGRYFMSIQAENNYQALYAGEEIIVSCSE